MTKPMRAQYAVAFMAIERNLRPRAPQAGNAHNRAPNQPVVAGQLANKVDDQDLTPTSRDYGNSGAMALQRTPCAAPTTMPGRLRAWMCVETTIGT
jgi:hypothetical protein